MINLFFEDTEILDVSPEFFVSWLSKVCGTEGKVLGELSIIFCSDAYLLGMNLEFLEHDYYTDIITFNYCEGDVISGDLFISIERVRDNSVEFGEMFHVELNRVVAHGVLHLMGYGDKTAKEEMVMRSKESAALQLIVPRETNDI